MRTKTFKNDFWIMNPDPQHPLYFFIGIIGIFCIVILADVFKTKKKP